MRQREAFYSIFLLFKELPRDGRDCVRATLERQADALLQACQQGRPGPAELMKSHALSSAASSVERGWNINDARTLVAREHGFADWPAVLAQGDTKVDPRFERCVDAIVEGDLALVQQLVEDDPRLVHARSPYAHRATLLNHVGANGVEHSRHWQSPANAPAIAQALIDSGADPDSTCNAGNGGRGATTLYLDVSSVHTAAAGVQAELVEVLCRGGAKPDGLDDDGLPLVTAITWGYTRAAERLAQCGARVDELVLAAALGDLARVKAYFDAQGRLEAAAPRPADRLPEHGQVFDPAHRLEYALIYAALHGRREVVELLLTKEPDLGVKEPIWGSTALGAARYPTFDANPGKSEIVELLASRTAP
jgi:hypothetical protein